MTPLLRGLVIATLHVGLVATLGGKLLYDRATLPRVWARTVPVDPDLPIRGRYLSLRLVVAAPEAPTPGEAPDLIRPVTLEVRDGRLAALPGPANARLHLSFLAGGRLSVLDEPVAFFIPEDAADPSRLAAGEELWAEVTVPRRGPPRPIRLEIRRGP